MFCPICKAEYRPGFTRCADCDVELVYELPAAAMVRHAAAAPGDPEEDPFCSFWKGDDPRVHAELCELFDGVGIPYKTIRRQDHLFNINMNNAFELGIPFSQFEKAEAVVKEAYGSEEGPDDATRLLPYDTDHVTDLGLFNTWLTYARGYANAGRHAPSPTEDESHLGSPEEQDSEREGSVVHSDRRSEDWFPEEATVGIWAGEQAEMSEMLVASLGENQIRSRVAETGSAYKLFVLPADEVRAREIVREVVEGVPPE